MCEEEGRVTSLSLSHNNLAGPVPMMHLLQLERLRTLKLDNNPVRFPYGVDLEDVSNDNLGRGINEGEVSCQDFFHQRT